jgi:alkanesulfonate monooxygenase SsuD/methylene tetrahydromethanopterin reductase-like flavin-dependent oxidoreductase (luciferase family)
MLHFPALLATDASRVQALTAGLAQSWNTTPAELEGRVLIGTPQQAAEKLLPYIELGAEHFVLSVAAPYDMSFIELFIQEVAPAAELLHWREMVYFIYP